MEKSLYNIEQEYIDLANLIIDNDGEATEDVINALQVSRKDLETKSVGYSKVIKQAKGEVSIIDSEIKRLQAEKKKRVNLENRLKEALTNAMNTFELDKLETPLCKISFRNSQSVEIEDIEKLPTECIVIEKKVSKTALKELLKNGDVEGAKLVNNKSIKIK